MLCLVFVGCGAISLVGLAVVALWRVLLLFWLFDCGLLLCGLCC